MKTEAISEKNIEHVFLACSMEKNLLKDQITKCSAFHLNVNFLANVSYIKCNDVFCQEIRTKFLITLW